MVLICSNVSPYQVWLKLVKKLKVDIHMIYAYFFMCKESRLKLTCYIIQITVCISAQWIILFQGPFLVLECVVDCETNHVICYRYWS